MNHDNLFLLIAQLKTAKSRSFVFKIEQFVLYTVINSKIWEVLDCLNSHDPKANGTPIKVDDCVQLSSKTGPNLIIGKLLT